MSLRSTGRPVLAVVTTTLLAACSSLMPQQHAAAPSRGLDYLNDDLASVVLAFDVPDGIEPVPDASTLTFAVSVPGQGERQVEARLARGDIGEAAGALPPPADNRTYFLFGFSPADQAKLRETQAWVRSIAQTGVQPSTPQVSIAPRFCTSAPMDPSAIRVSVLMAIPSRGVVPLLSSQSLAALMKGSGPLPPCVGHSG